jgi:hypothetical protein
MRVDILANMTWKHDDGGRAAAGYKGEAGDCGVRAIAIVTGRAYAEVYAQVNDICSKRVKTAKRANEGARTGLWPDTITAALGPEWEWVPTMSIGSGCSVHLRASELPNGRIIARVSKHYVAVIDGVIHDTHNAARNGKRCVYGYWREKAGAR